MSEFKKDDLVYYPIYSNKILVIKPESNYEDYPFGVYPLDKDKDINWFGLMTNDGKSLSKHKVSSLFLATQENYELLSKIYPNVSFEPPPKE